MQMLPALFDPRGNSLPEDDGMDYGNAGTGAAGLHFVQRRDSAAQEATGFAEPPCINDDRFALAHNALVPLLDFGLDGLADGRHVLEVVIVP
ncbi:hypothetical protein [Paraburkholderia tropica]|uniref:hypothetical protein n=1 Tax=Paraburkholderia tropica TaxID=92647 RepID=UPI002AB6F80C|nr:hypothetical protein [Paraburkholderia tropica]